MSGFNWEIGKRYKTRGGDEVLLANILPTDGEVDENLVFLTEPDSDPEILLCYSNGREYWDGDTSIRDVVGEWSLPETITAHGRTYKLVEE